MTPASETPRQTWERYASAWKAPTEPEKRALLAESTAEGCRYTDPLATTEGHDALVGYMLAFHAQIPGGHFVTRQFWFHNGRSGATWELVDADGQVLGEGISFGEYASDGRLRAMTGFYDVAGAPA